MYIQYYSVCIYIYVCVCICICMYFYIYIYICASVCVCVCVCACVRVRVGGCAHRLIAVAAGTHVDILFAYSCAHLRIAREGDPLADSKLLW